MDVVDLPELSARLDLARSLPVPDGHISTPVLRHGTMELRLFRPGGRDPQTPHDRDELYIVVAGSAVLVRGSLHSPWDEPALIEQSADQIALQAGDSVVVPAGTTHNFVDISPDFTTWMIFWGPEGGEAA